MGKGNIIGLEKIIGKLNDLPVEIQKDVDSVIAENALAVVNLAKTLAPEDEGRLRGSITNPRMLAPANYELTAGGSNAFYAPYLEFGTGPKCKPWPGYEDVAAEYKNLPKRGNFDQFVKNLTRWLHNKAVGSGQRDPKSSRKKYANEDEKRARWLAIKILKNGIEPKYFWFKSLETIKPKLLAEVEKVVNKKR